MRTVVSFLSIVLIFFLSSNSAFSQAGASLNFDGVDDYVSITNNASIPASGAVSVEAWIKYTPGTGRLNWFKKGTTNGYGLYVQSDMVSVITYGSVNWGTGVFLTPNTWHHITFTFDGTTQRLYKNGVLSASIVAGIMPASANAYIGGNFTGAEQGLFRGSIDELRVWDKALSAAEIQANMTQEISAPRANLRAYYKFNQGNCGGINTSITTVDELSGNNMTGALVNFSMQGIISNFVEEGAFANGVACPQFEPPVITSFAPITALPGATVTINGTDFDPAPLNNIVTFGAVRATVLQASSTQLQVTVPARAMAGPLRVTKLPASLAATSTGNFTPAFSPNTGELTSLDFALPARLSSPNADVHIADIDRDGKPDLVTIQTGGVAIFRNNSTSGTLNASSFDAPVIIPATGSSVCVADANNDGWQDLLLIRGNVENGIVYSRLVVMKHTGSPGALSASTFTSVPTTFIIQGSSSGGGLGNSHVADIDGDGRLDFICAGATVESGAYIAILKNQSGGSEISFASTYFYFGVLIETADVDGDAKPDLLISKDNKYQVLRNIAVEGPINASSFAAGAELLQGVTNESAFEDIDNDGRQDLVLLSPTNGFVYQNLSSPGSFSFVKRAEFSLQQSNGQPRLNKTFADADGDGKVDILVKNQLNTIGIFRNTSSANNISFAADIAYPFSRTTTLFSTSRIWLADLDGDAKADLVTATRDSITILANQQALRVSINPTPATLCNGSGILYAKTENKGVSFVWSNGTATDSNRITQPGAYTVTIAKNGFTASATVNATSSPDCGGFLELVTDPVRDYFDTLNVTVKIRGGLNVFSVYSYLHFDNTIMQLVESTQGLYLGADVISSPPVVSGGTIDFGMTKTFGQPGSNGDGVIYSFKFVLTKLPVLLAFNPDVPNTFVSAFAIDNIQVYNTMGVQPPSFNSLSLKNANTRFRYYVPVWPGDLNNDRRVNVADILPIGYFYGSTGPIRPNGSLMWSAQPAPLWGFDKTFTRSVAWKTFADGNADGVINLSDQAAIGFNLGATHAKVIYDSTVKERITNGTAADPAINVVMSRDNLPPGSLPTNEVVTISIGSPTEPLQNLYGIAFDLLFDPAYVNPAAITTSYTGSIFGSLNSTFTRIEDRTAIASGRLSIGITRFNTTNITASGGTAMTVTFPIIAGAPGGNFRVVARPLGCNDNTGTQLSVIGGSDSLTVQTPPPCATNYWTGAVSDAWENPANWSCGSVPGDITDVYIQSGKPNYPRVNSMATCKSITTESGASCTIVSGFKLTIKGN
jgi:hypothetical protein